jgi:hypothetical protein
MKDRKATSCSYDGSETGPRGVEVVNRDELERLKDAVQIWASAHPAQDGVAMVFSSGEALTPLEVAQNIQDETPLGGTLIEVVDLAIPQLGFDHILARLVDPGTESDPGTTPEGGPSTPPEPAAGGFVEAVAEVQLQRLRRVLEIRKELQREIESTELQEGFRTSEE